MKKSKYLLLSAAVATFFAVFAEAQEKQDGLVTTKQFCFLSICIIANGGGGGIRPNGITTNTQNRGGGGGIRPKKD